jgi:hypothetical protein
LSAVIAPGAIFDVVTALSASLLENCVLETELSANLVVVTALLARSNVPTWPSSILLDVMELSATSEAPICLIAYAVEAPLSMIVPAAFFVVT